MPNIPLKVIGQTPARMEPLYQIPLQGNYAVEDIIDQTVTPALKNPTDPAVPVEIQFNGQPVPDDALNGLLLSCLNEKVNVSSEEIVKELFEKTLIAYQADTFMLVRNVFLLQAIITSGLPIPDDDVFYTPAKDIIPAFQLFAQGKASYDRIFAALGGYCQFEALGFSFRNTQAWADFKLFLTTQTQNMQLDAKTSALISNLATLPLKNAFESIRIRNEYTDNMEDNSFARILISVLMDFCKQNPDKAGCMPFDMTELICPKVVLFINEGAVAQSTSNQIASAVKDINDGIAFTRRLKPTQLTDDQIMNLTTITKGQRINNKLANEISADHDAMARLAHTKFSSERPDMTRYVRMLMLLNNHMTTQNRTNNIYKSSKNSFNRANRREPDNPNKMGKLVSHNYRPDIHAYVDTSGSISMDDFKSEIMLLVVFAKKMNVNIYITFFAGRNCMTKDKLVICKDKSISEIYRTIMKMEKVSGGTDFEQVWHHINNSKKRQRELSFMITDFEWSAASYYVAHPKNLYYLPVSGNFDWDEITQNASYFMESVKHNDRCIRKHILF